MRGIFFLPLAFAAQIADAAINPGTALTVGIFLKPPEGRLEAMEKKALQVSDPDHESYGRYLTRAEVTDAVGLSEEAAERAHQWLAKALDAAKSQGPRELHVVANRDLVTATLPLDDFSVTYRLGKELEAATTPGAQASIPPPPEDTELLLTPKLPDEFCNVTSEAACNAAEPCSWNAESKACKGEFHGWMCYPKSKATGQWTCYEPPDVDDMNVKVTDGLSHKQRMMKRMRKGKSRKISLEAQHAMMASMADSRKYKGLGFFAAPISATFTLSYGEKPENPKWTSAEVTYRQSGRHHTRTLHRSEFSGTGGTFSYEFTNVENLRLVDNLAVCLNEVAEGEGAPSAVDSQKRGCVCNMETGRDERLGRPCEALRYMSPANDPVDYILPRGPQTLSASKKMLGMYHESAPLGLAKNQQVGPDNMVAVGEFLDQTFAQEDMTMMQRALGLPIPKKNMTVIGPRSYLPLNDMNAGEGSLDAQVVATVAPEYVPVWYALPFHYMEGFMVGYAVLLNDDPNPPLVHGVSWGDSESPYPKELVKRLDYEFMKLALRGITMVLASGDNGIRSAGSKCDFIPDLVASSPWVTSVGATMLTKDAAPFCYDQKFKGLGTCEESSHVVASVMAGAIVTSSGYFSGYRERPAFQKEAVAKWLQVSNCTPCRTESGANAPWQQLTAPCLQDKSGRCSLDEMVQKNRGVPDVSLPGSSFPTVVGQEVSLLDGTSASAPLFTAFVANLNAEQMRRGQPPLGFMNPWLYKTAAKSPRTFIDVTVGGIGSTVEERCDWGFNAEPGWDPASGLGVPQFDRLLDFLPKRREAAPAELSEAAGAQVASWMGLAMASSAAGFVVGALFVACLLVPRLQARRCVLPTSLTHSLIRF